MSTRVTGVLTRRPARGISVARHRPGWAEYTAPECAEYESQSTVGAPIDIYRPVCPSNCSRRMSAWPACLAVSSTMWTRTHRSDSGSGVVGALSHS